MRKYLLDTNIVIYVMKRLPRGVGDTFNRHAGHMAISSITLAELLHGAEKSSNVARNLAEIENFCGRIEVLPYGEKAAAQYGRIRAVLERAGTPIGINDLHIAAHACSEALILVSNNLREFERVPGLISENWL